MFRLLPSFSKILLNLNNIKASRVSFLKVFSDLNNIKDENERDTRIKLNFKDNIEIKSLSFKYTNREKNVLENINFSVKKGEMIGLIGESGSGKSTLIEIIMGFLKPINGEIKVDGKNIFDNLREWRNQIGYVTQNVFLIDDTILNNIALGVDPNEIDLDRIKDCIAQAKLEVFRKEFKRWTKN